MAGVQNDEHAPTLTVTQARQGRRGYPMVWVLGISMALVVVGFAALWLARAPGFSGSGGQTTASAKTTPTLTPAPGPGGKD
jgi:hypothetical protein